MLTHVAIRQYQSLRTVDLTLGPLTVVVGPSSSGKSAVIRAVRALASNTTGNAAITRGATSAAITATTHTGDRITLEYNRGAWRYRLLHDGQELEYTKLNRSVPDRVTQLLRIPPAPATGSLHFASQFDRPYLLTDSGATIARHLGELTNVDRIYAAVREANRRKAADAATLKLRTADLTQVTAATAQFVQLPQQLAAVDSAEHLAAAAATLSDRLTRLCTLLDQLTAAEAALAATAPVHPIPDPGLAEIAMQERTRFRARLHQLMQSSVDVSATQATARDAAIREQLLQDEHQQYLTSLRTCPTCERPFAVTPATPPR